MDLKGLRVLGLVLLLALVCIVPVVSFAQTATTGVLVGTVVDPTGASVPDASITLEMLARAIKLSATTDAVGHYIFPSVEPGLYTLKVSAKGFRVAIISGVKVQIAQSNTADVKLEIGATTQTVEVVATTGTELQTTDASIGSIIASNELDRLPALARSTASIILEMPGVAPDTGGGDTSGGQIAGARSEQVTFTVDGGDATSDLEGSNSYISPNAEPSAISPVVPIPVEVTEEVRVSQNNPNASFGGSSGGQVSMVTKSGTNDLHGTVYEYHSDNGMNANSWQNDSLGVHKPHAVDNRFGAVVDGPIVKNKLFFSGFYEGRRFYDSATVTRIVPRDTLKQGILQFPDAAGNVIQYNFNPALGPLATVCSSTGAADCDPRAIGVSPVIMSQLALYPSGNDPSHGDGFNTIGLTGNVAVPVLTNTGKAKLNYVFNDKWSAFVTFQLSKSRRVTTDQISILNGGLASASGSPYMSNFFTFQVQGVLTPHLTSVTHGSFLRNWWAWLRTDPTPFVNGTDSALQIAGEGVGSSNSSSKLLADPVNINTQQARSRVWDGHDWYIAQDFSLIKGAHTVQFGGTGRIWNDYHMRTDDVLGGLTSAPIYYIGARGQSNDSYTSIGADYEPVTCPTSTSTNCIKGSSLSRWNGLYASLLGIVDHSTQIQTRDGNFNPNPLGTALYDKVKIPAFTTYLQDIWKIRPSLTLTVGLNWGAQITPSELDGKEVVLTYADTNTPVDFQQYLQNRISAMNAGNIYNPTFGLVPVNHLSDPLRGKMRVTDWTDLSPRISAAWQVPFKNKVFGDHQTVIRGGYAKVYDRASAVNQVLSPLLTGGLADADQCKGPFMDGSCGHSRNYAYNAYRIGVDGVGPGIPAPSAKPIPFVPGVLGLYLSAPLDPYATPGYAHSIDLTVQRAFSNGFFVETGYIGRFSRNLAQAQAINAPYYNMKDPGGSGQTYAQAFDGLAQQVRAGASTFTPQPFFENVIGTANCVSQGFADCTTMEANYDPGDLIIGDLNSFGSFELNFDAPQFLDNEQFVLFSGVTDHGYSNYNAWFMKVRRNVARGLSFSYDWTWSHAIGNGGTNQQYIYSSNSPYNINIDKASEVFDHRNVMHAFVYYDLPFGHDSRYLNSSGSALNRVVGGWSLAGVWTRYSGAPACVYGAGDYGSFLSSGTCAIPSSPLPSPSVHKLADGSLNFYADPAAVYSTLSYPLISQQGRVPFDQTHALPFWGMDFSLKKKIPVTEKIRAVVQFDAFNLLNHPIFGNPSLDITDPAGFGKITGTSSYARRMQFGVKIEF